MLHHCTKQQGGGDGEQLADLLRPLNFGKKTLYGRELMGHSVGKGVHTRTKEKEEMDHCRWLLERSQEGRGRGVQVKDNTEQ